MRAGKRCDIPKLFEENTTIRRPFKTDAPVKDGPRSNREIRVPRVQLINAEGENLGPVPTDQALKMAEEAGLDLVEIPGGLAPLKGLKTPKVSPGNTHVYYIYGMTCDFAALGVDLMTLSALGCHPLGVVWAAPDA